MASIGTNAALVTADSQAALLVLSRTPKASATGDMKLPAREIDRPVKNHRKAGERSGLADARLVLDAGLAALPDGSEPRLQDAAALDTRCHVVSAERMHQVIFGGSVPSAERETGPPG